MNGFVEVRSLTGPALVRVDRIVLVRPAPDGGERTLVVMENGHEMTVRQRTEEVLAAMQAPNGREPRGERGALRATGDTSGSDPGR